MPHPRRQGLNLMLALATFAVSVGIGGVLIDPGGSADWLRAASQSGPAPRETGRRLNRGIARLEQYEYRAAIGEFRKALESDPASIPARVNLGIAQYYDADLKGAEESLRTVLRAAPDQPNALFMLGLVLGHDPAGSTGALEQFRKVEALFPDDPGTLYNIGLLLMRGRDYDGAARQFNKVLGSDPRHLSAIWNLSMSLMRAGRREEGRRILERLKAISGDEQPGATMGTRYDEEGRFAKALDLPLEPVPASTVQVRFTDVSAAAGLRAVPGESPRGTQLPVNVDRGSYSPAWAERSLVPLVGSGAAFFDYDNDGFPDLYVPGCSADGSSKGILYRNKGDGTFVDVSAATGTALAGRGMGVAAGDYDNDGFTDLYLSRYGTNVLLRNTGKGTFDDVTAAAGVAGGDHDWSLSAAFVDVDHDGDLDLYVCNFVGLDPPAGTGRLKLPDDLAGQSNRLFRNNGDGTFADTTSAAGVAGAGGRSTSVVATDFNETRDVDLLVFNYSAPPFLLRNNRDGSFSNSAPGSGLTTPLPGFGGAVADLDRDGFPDIFAGAAVLGREGYLLKNREGRSFVVAAQRTAADGRPHWASAPIDFDNDGLPDILSIEDGRIRLFRNAGPGRDFTDVSGPSGLGGLNMASARTIAVGDYDGDGDADVVVSRSGATPILLRNDGGNRNRSLRLRLSALNDNRSAFGAKIEVRAGLLRQKFEWTGGCSYLSQGSGDLLVGLGAETAVEAVRVLWPTGVLQSELDPPAGKLFEMHQVDRKGTSCPILYAWNGTRYEFVTDFLGGGAIGSLVAPGSFNNTDPDEYVLVKPDQLRPKDGIYSIKMNDQLEEVLFIDRAKLVVADHPADVQVFPNERLMPAPPYPGFEIVAVRSPVVPRRVVDEKGKDHTAALRAVDRKYPDGFALLPFKGYAEPHTLELDFGARKNTDTAFLLLTAWIDYADSSSNLAASQAGIRLQPPILEQLGDDGRWVPISESMGFPAGLPKTMTVDLRGKLRPARELRLRIRTNMRIYWDQILLEAASPATPVRTYELEASAASLAWAGYPREYSPDGRKPRMYDYSRRDESIPWKTHAGVYTRYGDVTELLAATDDMYVIMRHGDEITVDFDGKELPQVPDGWTRSFLVYAAGYGKDMDRNSAWPDTVLPLPFRGMTGYPLPGSYPSDDAYTAYMAKYNTRRYPGMVFGAGASVWRR